jgi:hypothetical protein
MKAANEADAARTRAYSPTTHDCTVKRYADVIMEIEEGEEMAG